MAKSVTHENRKAVREEMRKAGLSFGAWAVPRLGIEDRGRIHFVVKAI